AHAETLAAETTNWKDTRLLHPDRFAVEEACALAHRASMEATLLADTRSQLTEFGLTTDEDMSVLEALVPALTAAQDHLQSHPKRFLLDLLLDNNARALSDFLHRCAEH